MRYVVSNLKKLTNIFGEIKENLEKNPTKSINLAWEFCHRDKTLSQLGFFFGGLVEAIQNHFQDLYGEEYSKELIKEMLYEQCGSREEFICPNGSKINIVKRISRMTVEEMSLFIEQVIEFCDLYEIVLQPELRYLWINNLDRKYIEEVAETKFPEKDPVYLAHVAKEACIICGKRGVHVHHAKSPELGGLGTRTPDWCGLPLCPSCHINHNGGHISTEKIMQYAPFLFKKLTMKEFCKLRYERYLRHK